MQDGYPHLLTCEQKKTRVTMAKKLLKMYLKYSKKTFDNIVTGDETMVYYFEPKQKVANRIWATKMQDAQVLPNEYER